MIGWFSAWGSEHLRGGVLHGEAKDSFLETGLSLEEATAEHKVLAGMVLDLVKAHNRIARQITYDIAKAAGLPSVDEQGAMKAWASFVDKSTRRFRIGGGLGQLFRG